MSSVTKFVAVNTKIRVLKRKMLTLNDYENLISKNNIEDFVDYLKSNTGYSEALEQINTKGIHRDKLEVYLKKYMINQYEKIIHFFIGEYRKLFKILFKKFEIEDLKLYLRTLARGKDLDSIKDLILYKGSYSTIDHDKLIKSKNISELIENLKGTIYYDRLYPYLDEEEDRLMFYIEMNLDRFYFTKLYEQIEHLKSTDRKTLEDILGINIDLLNIEWLYRGRKFFNLSKEELVNYALKGGRITNYNLIKKLSYANSEQDFIEIVATTPYYFLFEDKNTIDLYMEIKLETYMYNRFLDYFNQGNMNIMVAVSYIHLLEYEIRDIISIAESIRYDLDKKETERYIIREISKEVK